MTSQPQASTMPTRAASERSLKPGDHAYVAPPFSQRGGSPYLIVRIVDLPPTPPGGIPKAKVAYYLRRRDVTNRSLADHRVIFATFMDGLVPLSHIRQKVQVMYRDYLEDPEAFKRQPDSFVFNQIYDRFMHKPFDLVPTSQVMNAPDNILEYLRTHYEFVCTELGSSATLCDAMRGCVTCHGFAAKDDSVTCTICSKTWHLGCLEPPLTKKPALGWRWSCIKCTMEQEDDDSDADSAITPNSDRNATRAARRKAKPLAIRKNGKLDKGKAVAVLSQLDVSKWKTMNGWPYRYFGEHVHHESVLDPHDPIWPRASTSVGTRFQCLDIPGEEPDTGVRRGPVPKKRRNKKKQGAEIPEPDRGLDEACEIIWQPQPSLIEGSLEDLLAPVKMKTVSNKQGNVDMIIEALKALHTTPEHDLRQQKIAELLAQPPNCPSLAHWSEVEMQSFDDDLEDHEDELGRYTRTRKMKSYPEIVHHYYREKGYQKRFMHLEDPAQDKFAAAGPQGIEAEQGDIVITEDEDGHTSVVEDAPTGSGRKSKHQCAMCGIDKAELWFLCPEGVGLQEVTRKDRVICPSCSIQWRHYGSGVPPLSEGELDNRLAKDGKSKGRGHAARRSASPSEQKPVTDKIYGRLKQQTDGSFITIPTKSCVLCKRPEPKSSNFECRECGVSVHSGCYGIPESASIDDWLCDACEVPQESATSETSGAAERSCYLCTKDLRHPGTALDAYKITAEHGPVHLLCALWHHEILFQDVENLRAIENIELLERQKFGPDKPSCSICKNSDEGACVKCDTCETYYHVGCAWHAGCRFSFEVRPVKEQWMSSLARATFKEETGDMQALIFCKSHPWTYTRLLYDLGQKDRNTDMTTLMTYAHFLKPADTLQKFPLLNTLRCMSLGLNVPKSPMDPATDNNEPAPMSLDEVYANKGPYMKPVKQTRKKRTVKQTQVGRPPNTGNIAGPAKPQPPQTLTGTVNGKTAAGDTVEPVQKKRKRNNSTSSHGASLSTSSEDEVMPTASTSRARGAARAVRSVTLRDLIMDAGTNDVNGATAGENSSSRRTKPNTVIDNGTSTTGALAASEASVGSPPIFETSDLSSTAVYINGHAQTVSKSSKAVCLPPWRTLALSSLLHVRYEKLRQSQGSGDFLSTSSLHRTASSSSSATIPLGRSPRPGKATDYLPTTYSRLTTPTHIPKLESETASLNGDLSNDIATQPDDQL